MWTKCYFYYTRILENQCVPLSDDKGQQYARQPIVENEALKRRHHFIRMICILLFLIVLVGSEHMGCSPAPGTDGPSQEQTSRDTSLEQGHSDASINDTITADSPSKQESVPDSNTPDPGSQETPQGTPDKANEVTPDKKVNPTPDKRSELTPEKWAEPVPETTPQDRTAPPDRTPPPKPKAPISPFIVVDQFGYLPNSEKIAVIRNPKVGFDARQSFQPGSTYALINANTGKSVLTGSPKAWGQGRTDASSGDQAWWFTFSSVTAPGNYYVLDQKNNVRSDIFRIDTKVYHKVLEQAVRSFFYQRSGFPKDSKYAGKGWADKASHTQDKKCRLYSAKNDASTERDLHGGWYDAGDYNKYTQWHASYTIVMMLAYLKAPKAFSDKTNIPESGNGIPDIIDEVKFGLEWLVRMQNTNGSVLSIVGADHASPPSAATKPCYYGRANTIATLQTAAAFALGAKVFQQFSATKNFANQLKSKAAKAYSWAKANPKVLFRNNSRNDGTQGLGAGQQETDDYNRFLARVRAAAFLFEVTGQNEYKTYIDQNYTKVRILSSRWTGPFEQEREEAILYYARLPKATVSVSKAIISAYQSAMQSSHNFGALRSEPDPYLAHMKDYVWGSNRTKASKGNMFLSYLRYKLDPSKDKDANRAASRYIHYIHGVNPLGIVYLSNMGAFGAHKSVNEFYHAWFTDGNAKWDSVGKSTYGPAPGFLTGGPNPQYKRDGCCPNNCGSSNNNRKCSSESLTPPQGQPKQKSYKDFNTSWPLNSWEVTENSNGYQVAYIYLLSHFAR